MHGAGLSADIWKPQLEAFRREYNLLLPELHAVAPTAAGHTAAGEDGVTFEVISRRLLDLLDHHGVERANFVGLSLGCLVITDLATRAPERVRSMVLAGAIGRLKLSARVLIALAHALKRLVPFMWLYRFYARILLPGRGHAASRREVVRQAGRLSRAEFVRWLEVTRDLPALLRRFEENDPGVPTLYVMGDQDHMFLPGVRAVAARHASAALEVVPDSGHVVTVQRAGVFNGVAVGFLGAVVDGHK